MITEVKTEKVGKNEGRKDLGENGRVKGKWGGKDEERKKANMSEGGGKTRGEMMQRMVTRN